MAMLKARQAQTKQKKKRVMIDLHPTEIYVLEKSASAKCICHHSLCDLTFVWNDQTGDHCCGLILRQTAAGKSTWEFYGFKLNGYRTAFIHALKYVFRNLELSKEQMPEPDSNLPPASCMDSAVVDNLIDLTDISTKPNAIPPKNGEQLFQVKIPTGSLILPPNPTRMRHNQIAHVLTLTTTRWWVTGVRGLVLQRDPVAHLLAHQMHLDPTG
ncbi:unnamed protein product [Dicrocoelium dendriticum]|nr:unnamed protein product [Dicrocoelium dendriticum]